MTPSSTARLLLPLLLAAAAAAAPDPAAAPSHDDVAGRRPNFVVLYVDDMGYGDLGCYGNRTSRTPNIDSLAENGVRFTQMLVAAPICTPSRTALLTGRLPVRSGMDTSEPNFRTLNSAAHPGGLPRAEETLAERLRDGAGYATALVGKWHLGVNNASGPEPARENGGHLPVEHGFDYFYGLPVTNVQTCGGRPVYYQGSALGFYLYRTAHMWAAALLGVAAARYLGLLGRGRAPAAALAALVLAAASFGYHYTVSWTLLSPSNCLLYRNREVIEQPLRLPGLTQRLTREATSFIERSAAQGRPFFLFLPYVKVHTALFTEPARRNRSGRGDFVDNVEELDWSVGEVLGTLRRLGVEEDTVVVLASDNGPFTERGHEAGTTGAVPDAEGRPRRLRGGKGQNFEGGVRVPGLVQWRGTVPPRVARQMASTMDVYPTLLRLAGVAPPSDGRPIDGVSLLPALLPRSAAERDSETAVREGLLHFCGTELGAARWRHFKVHYLLPRVEADTAGAYACEECCPRGIICHCGSERADPPLLFDLRRDPGERHPLRLEEHPEAAAAFERLRAEHEASTRLPLGGRNVENQLTKFVRPWLQPCCDPPACRCCRECSPEEGAAHRERWGY